MACKFPTAPWACFHPTGGFSHRKFHQRHLWQLQPKPRVTVQDHTEVFQKSGQSPERNVEVQKVNKLICLSLGYLQRKSKSRQNIQRIHQSNFTTIFVLHEKSIWISGCLVEVGLLWLCFNFDWTQTGHHERNGK